MTPAYPCYVFDIDGTLADMSHRLHYIVREPGDDRPKDWRACFSAVADDAPIFHMVRVCQALARDCMDIVFVSGRSDECRASTVAWLLRYIPSVRPANLCMRRAGDHRPDDIVKREILDQMRADGWRPVMAPSTLARAS